MKSKRERERKRETNDDRGLQTHHLVINNNNNNNNLQIASLDVFFHSFIILCLKIETITKTEKVQTIAIR